MDWLKITRDFLRMERRSVAHFASSRQLDSRHFVEQERIFTDWLSETKAAGLVAPNLFVAAVFWLGGVFSPLLPKSLVRLAVVVTIGYVAILIARSGDQRERSTETA